ncbi:MAG: DUF4331 domain-containing protein [Chloroflexota bacterium]
MSSHREAPEIAKDPVADSTDLYAFVSPDHADTVTLIANYVPFELPAGGPNFYEFGDDVLYEINIDNNGDDVADITYRFQFRTEVRNPNTFLYNTGPITSLDSPNWNRRQFYTVSKVVNGQETVLGENLSSPPCNIGPRSTPNYESLAQAAIHTLPGGGKVFAGQRREGFYADLGAIFDLGALRPVQEFHLIPMAATMGVDALKNLNVHTLALQVPKRSLTAHGSPATDPASSQSVIGVWTAAYRRKARVRDQDHDLASGPWVQVSRLGNPLFNEVIVPMVRKDQWNSVPPSADEDFIQYVQRPELARLLPVLYPGVFLNLAAYTKVRADLVAILLTGIPAGVVPGFPGNFTGKAPADLLRLNMAISPSSAPSMLGLLGGDIAGYPNGRRVSDDVVTIEVRAVAGATIPFVDPSFTPDAALPQVTQGVNPGPDRYIPGFPYLGVPKDGFNTPSA